MNDYDRLKELADNATPGPYHIASIGPISYALWVHDGPASHLVANRLTKPDAEFIAAAHPDAILNLLEDLRLTRADLAAEKHKCLEYRKENAALRRGQGRASC